MNFSYPTTAPNSEATVQFSVCTPEQSLQFSDRVAKCKSKKSEGLVKKKGGGKERKSFFRCQTPNRIFLNPFRPDFKTVFFSFFYTNFQVYFSIFKTYARLPQKIHFLFYIKYKKRNTLMYEKYINSFI